MAKKPPHPQRDSEIERFGRNLANWLKCHKGTAEYSRFQGMLESQIATLKIVGVITPQGAVKLSVQMWESRRALDAEQEKPAHVERTVRLPGIKPPMQAVLITGPAGVGKSHLLSIIQARGATLHLLDPFKGPVSSWSPPTEPVDAVVFDNYSALDNMPPVMVEAFEWCLANNCALILSVQALKEAPSQPWTFAPASQTLIHLVSNRDETITVVLDGEQQVVQYDALVNFAMAAIGVKAC